MGNIKGKVNVVFVYVFDDVECVFDVEGVFKGYFDVEGF